MKTIFKYPVIAADFFPVEMPKGARFVSVDIQHDSPQMWFLVDTDQPIERRFFSVCGTGNPLHPAAEDMQPLGSFQLYGGGLVFHLFG